MDVLEQMGGGDVGHVERRILAHQHHVHRGEIEQHGFAERVVRAALAFDGDRADAGEQAFLAAFALTPDAFAQRQVADLVVPQRVAATLGLQHQRERGIGVDVDVFDRVHLHRDLQLARHGDPLSGHFQAGC